MRMRRRQNRVLALAASGLLFVGSGGNCLPNDFLQRFVGPARDSLIQALTSNFIFNVADTIIPPPEAETP